LTATNIHRNYPEFRKALSIIGKLFFIGGGALTILFALSSNSKTIEFLTLLREFLLNGTSFTIMWLGNGFLADWLNIQFPWTESTQKRLIVSLIATAIYTFLAWLFFVFLWHVSRHGFENWQYFTRTLQFISFFITFLITLTVSGFVHGGQFLNNWKMAAIETERLKKEQISAMYEILKAQINPHFLFNSFNVLSTLVHKDADLAEKFINQLSKVYRYVLQTRDKEVVSLSEELEELDAYIFLMKIRFGESFIFNKNIQADNIKIAPLTLQILIENALKHNEASNAHPLSIELFEEANFIVVMNNIQRKNNVLESTGIGLENITAQYSILSNKKVEITEDKHHFIVKIPKILNESSHN
jgi:sensor histidine kinase YesM